MADLPLSPDDVAEIVAILDGTPYERIDIRTKRFSLRVARSGAGWTQSWEWPSGGVGAFAAGVGAAGAGVGAASEAAPPGAVTATTATTASTATPTGTAAAPAEGAVEGTVAVKALLPGTFYRSPQPGAPPFIEPGARVEAGTVVGIIETMKLMTPVHAGADGTVVAIVADNAASVELGEVLMRVAPVSP
jgi:acetyl-CoA carboxylase biotin carboxyl carrier protein